MYLSQRSNALSGHYEMEASKITTELEKSRKMTLEYSEKKLDLTVQASIRMYL